MNDGKKIGHAEIRIGGSLLMLADEYPDLGIVGPRALGGSPVRMQAHVPDVDAVVKRAAAAGAKVLQPPTDQPHGERNAKIEDPFGHVWNFSMPLGKPAVRPIRRATGPSRRIWSSVGPRSSSNPPEDIPCPREVP